MPEFDPNPHLKLARVLAEQLTDAQADSEIRLRTAVGRAYYAVLLLARDIVNVWDEERVHAEVIYQVSRKYGRLVADKLRELRELRVQADYRFPSDTDYSDWDANWRDADRLSGQVIERLKVRR